MEELRCECRYYEKRPKALYVRIQVAVEGVEGARSRYSTVPKLKWLRIGDICLTCKKVQVDAKQLEEGAKHASSRY